MQPAPTSVHADPHGAFMKRFPLVLALVVLRLVVATCRKSSIGQLLELTSDGAVLRSIKLSPPVPAGPLAQRGVQLVPIGAKLLNIAPTLAERTSMTTRPRSRNADSCLIRLMDGRSYFIECLD